MDSIENYLIIVLGFIPVIYSAVKVERHYTNYYTAAWNLYGSILVIIGFMFENSENLPLMLSGLITITIFVIIVSLSKYIDDPGLIRFFGKSVIQFSIQVGFMTYSILYNFQIIEDDSKRIVLTIFGAIISGFLLFLCTEQSSKQTANQNFEQNRLRRYNRYHNNRTRFW